MAARAGMTDIIYSLRGLCEAGTADYVLTGFGTAWSDDHLQDILDEHRADINEDLSTTPRYSGSTEEYYDYYFASRPVERAASGSAVFHVYNSLGSAAGTASYTVNYRAGHIEFTADQGQTQWAIRARAYDLNGAAAAVWRQKAAHYQASGFDIKTDNHDLKRSQLVDRALKMAEKFEDASTGAYGSMLLKRSDAY
jgi:hypothetical protein